MEITLFKSQEPDRSKWDAFILSSPQGFIYGLSEYLDIISPNWEAFICHKEDKWLAVLPWFPKKKIGIKYVYQPILCQFQGIYFSESANNISDQRNIALLVAETIKRNCLVFHCNFSGNFIYPFPFVWKGFSVQPMVNFRLPLIPGTSLTQNFSHGTLENIKKARRSKLSFRIGTSIEDALQLFKKYRSAELKSFGEKNIEQLRGVYEVFNKKEMAYITECHSEDGDLLATLLLLKYKDCLIQLFATVSDDGKKCGAMAYSVQQAMELGIEKGCTIFDFEGSMIEPIESFFRSFGAQPQTYWKIRRSPVTSLLKNLF